MTGAEGLEFEQPMVVLVLAPDDLDRETEALVGALASQGVRPTHVVAIASAGSYVAASMLGHLGADVTLVTLECRRPTTRVKQWLSPLARLARFLPDTVLDAIRIAESRFVTSQLNSARTVQMSTPDKEELRLSANSDDAVIVIVDDCVDTGATLRASTDFVRELAGVDTEIRTATLTMVLQHPEVFPDICLYRNAQVRGPWSYDYRPL